MSHLQSVLDLIEDWKRKDIEAVLARVSDDIVYYYAIGEAPLVGRDKFLGFLNRIKDHQQNPGWRVKRHAEAENIVMVESVDEYTNPAGVHIVTPHMTVYEFSEDGKICGWRDYFDYSLLKKAEAGEAANEHAASLAAV